MLSSIMTIKNLSYNTFDPIWMALMAIMLNGTISGVKRTQWPMVKMSETCKWLFQTIYPAWTYLN